MKTRALSLSLSASVLLCAAGRTLAQPGDWGSEIPRLVTRPCPEGIIVMDPQVLVYIRQEPSCPTFTGITEGHYRPPSLVDVCEWEGSFYDDCTIINLSGGEAITVYLTQHGGLFGPWITLTNFHCADWNLDDKVDSTDIAAFLTDYITMAPYQDTRTPTDYNADGQVSPADITSFLTAWLNR